MNTLLIIDMQKMFLSERNLHIVDPIKNKIEEFKSNGDAIIFVEFCSAICRTIKELTFLTKKYPNTFTVNKNKVSGAEEIDAVIKKNRLPTKLFICGLYGDDCVFNTSVDLRLMGYKLSGFTDCIGYFDDSKKQSFDSFYK